MGSGGNFSAPTNAPYYGGAGYGSGFNYGGYSQPSFGGQGNYGQPFNPNFMRGGIGAFNNFYQPPQRNPYQSPYTQGYGYSPPMNIGFNRPMFSGYGMGESPYQTRRPPTAETLDSITKDYTNEYNQFISGGGTEEDYVSSPQFQSFENKLIRNIGGVVDRDRLNSDLDQQRQRAAENSVYSPSAQRITKAIERRLGQLDRQAPAPTRQMPRPGGMSMGLGGVPIGYGSSLFSRVPDYYSRVRRLPYQRYGTTPGGYDFIGETPAEEVTYAQPVATGTTDTTGSTAVDTSSSGTTASSPVDFFKNLGGTEEGISRDADGEYYFNYPGGGKINIPMTDDFKNYLLGIGDIDQETAGSDKTQTTESDPPASDAPKSSSLPPVDLTGKDRASINQEYATLYNRAMEGGATEDEWINSQAFKSFEDAIINDYISTNDVTVMQAEADRQRARTGPYAESGKRIADALQNAIASMVSMNI